MNTIKNPEAYWSSAAMDVLVGRRIVGARYLSSSEAEKLGWNSRSVVFELDNGVLIFPSRDDEGNDAGSLFTTHPTFDTLPVLRAAGVA